MSGRVLVVCDDLLAWTRIRETARARGREAVRVSADQEMRAAHESGGVDLILVDLDARSVDVAPWVAAWKRSDPPPRIVGFGSHVDTEAFARAREAGFDRVLARGRLDRDLDAIL